MLLGNGDGTFQREPKLRRLGQIPLGLAVGDFNGDGKLDLAVANYGANTVSVLLGNGDGTLPAQDTTRPAAIHKSVAVGDFNGDGAPTWRWPMPARHRQRAARRRHGRLCREGRLRGGSRSPLVAVGDFNSDGKLDLAVTNNGANTVSVLLGNGDGTFQPKTDYPAGHGSYAVAAADFNRDGRPDLATADSGASTVSVLLNRPGPPAGPPPTASGTSTCAPWTVSVTAARRQLSQCASTPTGRLRRRAWPWSSAAGPHACCVVSSTCDRAPVGRA